MAVFTFKQFFLQTAHVVFLTMALSSVAVQGSSGLQLSILGPHAFGSNEWIGTSELRAGSYSEALHLLEEHKGIVDSSYHFFKLGQAYYQTGQTGEAIRALRMSAVRCSLTAPAAYELIGDTEIREGRFASALSAYRLALDYPIPQRYQAHLNDKIARTASLQGLDFAGLPWLSQWLRAYEHSTVRLHDKGVDSLAQAGNWQAVDSTIDRLLDAFNINDNCKGFGLICDLSIPPQITDSFFSTLTLFRLSRKAYQCGRQKSSNDWLQLALVRKDFAKTVPNKEYLYHRGMLNYAINNFDNAITWLMRYEKAYGNTPDQVMTLARAYRKLGNHKLSSRYYDLHLKLYPEHSRTLDILWLRAWQKEDKGNLREALVLYRALARNHRTTSRGAESLFRAGLTLYKLKEYTAALDEWRGFIRIYPSAALAVAARFWTGKCHVALGQRAEAAAVFDSIAQSDPYDYYAYRCQEMLVVLGTPLPLPQPQVVGGSDIGVARNWLDSVSVSQKQVLTTSDSLAILTGIRLAFCGLADQASYYIEPRESKYRSNLAIQFDIASLYLLCGDPAASFRIARQMRWTIPQQSRSSMPFAVKALLYPSAYSSRIYHEAERNSVEPFLVSAIIRQESIFDAAIVSPVGAIGLMQIMPATGQAIAQELSSSFANDSLYNAGFNIRFGAYYISTLVKQFDGNIVLAIAGYNAGPHNAKRWFEMNRRDDFDLFVEDVGYAETRGYVKKVLGNYWTYARMHHEAQLWVGAPLLSSP